MDNRLYWLWLQNGLGYGANTNALMSMFESARAIYEAGPNEMRVYGVFSEGFFGLHSSGFAKLESADISAGKPIIDYCDKNGIQIITPDNSLYPKKLLQIQNYPLVLFVKGDISFLNSEELTFGVIGTRRPSEYGVKAANQIARGLAKNGATIVSGGALGIDSVAHRCAIEEGSKTVLVMGCGHDSRYLSENAELREQVTQHGATITEYPPFSLSGKGFFPLRNRIISGISDGVVIIEANLRSGTLNTAAHAQKQHRNVFAVPGDVSSVSYAGSNKLIIDGAHAVFSAADVLNHYRYVIAGKREMNNKEPAVPFEGIDVFLHGENDVSSEKTKVAPKPKNVASKPKLNNETENLKKELEGVSKNAALVYNVMNTVCVSLDEIVRESGLPVNKVLVALTELEINKAVISMGGNNYKAVSA